MSAPESPAEDRLESLLAEIRACRHCAVHLPLGPRPVLRVAPTARVLIVGQAPGTRVHESGVPWDDRSGARLRDWLQMPPETFYDTARIAIVPMGFCYPGVDSRGGDNPPRPECAPLWHARVHAHLPEVGLTLLVGQYAQRHYLGKARGRSLTETVSRWGDYLESGFFPLPHPSWRTIGWQKKNPWFEAEALPALRARLDRLLAG